MNTKTTIYNKDYFVSDSLITSWRKTIQEVWNHRWLIWVDFKKDFFSQYKQSGFGMIWSLIMPIIPVSVYIFLGYLKVLKISGGMPFPVYIIIGMTFWMLLREGISSGLGVILRERGTLSKVNMSLIVIILSKYGKVCANTLIRLIFLIIIMIFYRIIPRPNIVLFPIILLPIVSFSLGFGIIMGIVNTANTDIENTITLILTYGVFVSSVIFPMPTEGFIGILNTVNILNHFIVGIRDFIVFGNFQHPIHFIISSVIGIWVMLLAIKWQHTLQYKVKNLL